MAYIADESLVGDGNIKLSDDWTLSRSRFYVESGIRSLDMDKYKRFADVHRFWTQG
jgi:hypothetical protein